MTRILKDVLEGEVVLSTRGDRARRVFRVEELTGPGESRLASAANASGLPRVGDTHPYLQGVQVLDITARPIANEPTMALVDVDYGVPSAADAASASGRADVSISASLITEETTRDINGAFLRTTWTFRFTTVDPGDPAGTRRIQEGTRTSSIHRVEVQVPTYSVQFTRTETDAPLAVTRRYSGKVNSSAFLNESADKWLCTVSSTQQAANEHRVVYAFTFNRRGWQAILTHTVDGEIPDDLTADGVQVKQVYPRINFNALGLPRI